MNPRLHQPRSLLRRAAVASVLTASIAVGVSACGNDNGSPGAGGSGTGGTSAAVTYVNKSGNQIIVNGSTLTFKDLHCSGSKHGEYSDDYSAVGLINGTKSQVVWTKKSHNSIQFGMSGNDSNNLVLSDDVLVIGGNGDGFQPSTFTKADQAQIEAAQNSCS